MDGDPRSWTVLEREGRKFVLSSILRDNAGSWGIMLAEPRRPDVERGSSETNKGNSVARRGRKASGLPGEERRRSYRLG